MTTIFKTDQTENMSYTSYKQEGGGEKRSIFCIPWSQRKDSSSHCWEAFEAGGSWFSAWLSINLAPTQNWLSDYIKQEDGCLCGSCPWTLLRRMTSQSSTQHQHTHPASWALKNRQIISFRGTLVYLITLLHQTERAQSLFVLFLFLKGEFLLHSFFFPFASSEPVYNNIIC